MPDRKIILAVTGPMASGKGTVSNFFSARGAIVLKFSDILREILTRLHQERSRKNIQALSTCLRAQFGPDLLARVMARNIEESSADLIVVDGARRPEDVSLLQSMPGYQLLAVTADAALRFERVRLRAENPRDTTKTWQGFEQEERAEAESGIAALMRDADHRIDNNGTLADLHAKLEELAVTLRI